jgi:hypothetical protein
MPSAEAKATAVKWACLGWIVAAAVVAVAGCQDRATTAAATTSTAQQPATPPGPVIDAGNGSDITNDFNENPIGAEQKWIGKRVRIRSMVTAIDRDERGFYVGLYHVFVYPAPSELANFGALRREQGVVVEATLTRFRTGDLAARRPAQVDAEDARLVTDPEPGR